MELEFGKEIEVEELMVDSKIPSSPSDLGHIGLPDSGGRYLNLRSPAQQSSNKH